MPGKQVQCPTCSKTMRSDNLKLHRNVCLTRHQKTAGYSDIHQAKSNVESKSDSDTGSNYSNKDSIASSDENSSSESLIVDTRDIADYALKDSVTKNHSPILPRNVRAIIVGKSGCGKTTFLTWLLLEPNLMDYDKLMVCGRSLHQPEYELMHKGFDKGLSKNQVRELFAVHDDIIEDGGIDNVLDEMNICKGGIDASFFNDVNMIPDPTEHDASQKNLLVLDDIMLSPQNSIEQYFSRGRHNNVDVIYITQSYFRLPRQTIRENANLFVLFPQDGKNLSYIYQDLCSGDDVSFEMFSLMCNDWWRTGKHNFITIDLSKPVNNGKYRKNFNRIWGYE